MLAFVFTVAPIGLPISTSRFFFEVLNKFLLSALTNQSSCCVIVMLDGTVVEGGIVAALEASMGTPLDELQSKVDEARETKKLDL